MATSSQTDTQTQTPANSERAKVKRQQKIAAKKEAKVAARAHPVAPSADQLLFHRLGHDMADGLFSSVKGPTESSNLVERLIFAKMSTLLTTTITATTITAENVAVTIQTPRPNHVDGPSSTVRCVNPIVKAKKGANILTLDDFAAMAALESLVDRFGRASHMGILDKSYTFFVSRARDAALYFKVKNKIAVVGGNPLCEPALFPEFLAEFTEYRKQFGWGISFLGASDELLNYAKEKKWVTMHFGVERVLNPLTNPVLLEYSGKRIIRQNKQLLDPRKGGITLEVYSPAMAKCPQLQEQLVTVYDAWRVHRNQTGVPQTYITVYEPFALPDLMTYIYTKGRDGKPNGFAALRKLGANKGYHIDPCVAAPGAPRGITDLLTFAAMALLNTAGISYLSFGFEPLRDLGEITGMATPMARLTRTIHRQVFRGLRVGGKKEYHDKFRPDELQQSGLHLVFPSGVPGPRHMAAIIHLANISVRQLLVTKLKHKPATFQENPAAVDN